MEDIPLFGDESTKVHKTKDEKLYYTDQEIVGRERATRKYLYALSVLVVVCVGVFGYLAYNSYVHDVTMSQQLSDLSISVESSFAALAEKIENLGRRVTGLEEKTEDLEQETAQNREAIQQTQEDLNEVKEAQEAQESLKITKEDAEQIALNWVAANIPGISVPHKQWDFQDGEYTVYEFTVDSTSPAKRVDQKIISVEEIEDGFLVEVLITVKGFTFTNDKLHWIVGVFVDLKGIPTQNYINFAY
jgi:cell division protein FtsB